MRGYYLGILGSASFLLLASLPSTGGGETLKQALTAAYNNSSQLSAARAGLDIQDEIIIQARSGLLPSVSLEGSVTAGSIANRSATSQPDESLLASLRLTGELLLFDGGSQKSVIDIENEARLALEQSFTETEQQVLLDAVSSYHEVLRVRSSLELEQNNQRLLQTELRAAKDRFELGAIARTDVSFVEARLAAIRGNVARLEGQLAIAREIYKFAVGDYPKNLAPTPRSPIIPTSVKAAVTLANLRSPPIVRAKHAVTIAELNLDRAAKILRSPRVSLRGSALSRLDLRGQGFSPTNSIELGLSTQIPLYRGGQGRSLVRQATANLNKSHSELRRASNQVLQQVTNAWTRLEIARTAIEASNEQIRYSEFAFEGVKAEASLGARTTLDVLDAEQDLLSAQTELISAKHDRDVAVYELLAAIGLLTPDHLGLDVGEQDNS